MLSVTAVAVAWAGFTGPNRTTTKTVRDPDGDQWFCKKSGYPTCWFATGNPCPDAGGSHPSTSAQMSVCGWPSPADSCGCKEANTTETVTLPAATVGGSEYCASPGANGWCRGGASLELNASEPVSGYVIESIEGNPGGVLCDPADSASVGCSYSVGGEGNFTIEFWALSSYGDTSEKSSAGIKVDVSPPSINLSVSGGSPGGGGWYRGGTLDVSVSGSDAVSGVSASEVSIDGGGWTGNAQVGGDGVHSISGRVFDYAGNQATDSTEIRIDGTPPSLSPELSGTKGKDGWFISPVSVFASASDGLSGVAKVEVSDGSGGWQTGPITISTDGTHKPRFRAEDVAGNETTEDGPTIKIDAHTPESAFINPPEGSETWVSGIIPLIGQSTDLTSGLLAVEISFDEGLSWSALDRTGGDWRTSWDSSEMPNGTYVVLARASDIAGNMESTARVTLRVDNAPPMVDIPEMWPVREPGTLIVEEGGIGLAGVEVVISDGESILESHQYSADEVPDAVTWDGRLPDGRIALPGEYDVMVIAWDLVGNRGNDAGRIVVPEVESVVAPVVPAVIDPAQPAKPNSTVPTAIEREAEAAVIQAQPWIWPAVAWIGLLSAVGYAKMADPRVKALRSLHDDLTVIRRSLNE
jgi:hypothetical protein